MELGPAQISREDGKRRIVIGFNVKGRDVQSVVNEIAVAYKAKVEEAKKVSPPKPTVSNSTKNILSNLLNNKNQKGNHEWFSV